MLSNEQIVALKQELNFLLWTSNIPDIPKGYHPIIQTNQPADLAKVNIQCTAHTSITSALFVKAGHSVTMRSGMAFLSCPESLGPPMQYHLHQIAKHWWFTIDSVGIVDLSLHSEPESPLIYCNKSICGKWQVHFTDSISKVQSFMATPHRGCLYVTSAKRQMKMEELASLLTPQFSPAKDSGIQLPYAHIVKHCERLLARGESESLTNMPQIEAWKRLALQN